MRHVVIAQEKTGGRAVVEGGPSCEDEEDVLDQVLGGLEEPQDGVGHVELLEEVVSHSNGQEWPGPVGILETLLNLSHTGRRQVSDMEEDGPGAGAKI